MIITACEVALAVFVVLYAYIVLRAWRAIHELYEVTSKLKAFLVAIAPWRLFDILKLDLLDKREKLDIIKRLGLDVDSLSEVVEA